MATPATMTSLVTIRVTESVDAGGLIVLEREGHPTLRGSWTEESDLVLVQETPISEVSKIEHTELLSVALTAYFALTVKLS